MNTVIRSLATATPDRYVKSEEAYEYFKNYWNLTSEQDELYKKILLKGPIKGRFIAVQHDTFANQLDQDKLIEQFTIHARSMNLKAATKAINQANMTPLDIDAVVVNTCTGYLCPGLSSYLIQDLNLPASTKVFDLMGMGCGAAIPNLNCASSLVNMGCSAVLCIAVEICSATIFNSPDPGCIISNCIFGDGAAAAVLTPEKNTSKALVKILDFQTQVFPQHRDSLKFVSDHGKLRNVLSRRVPVIGANAVHDAILQLFIKNNLSAKDIQHWAIHPGGTAVLNQVQKKLKLTYQNMKQSLNIFKKYGNMSSPSVMFVLKSLLNNTNIRPDELCCALSFGAGFNAHATLLKTI